MPSSSPLPRRSATVSDKAVEAAMAAVYPVAKYGPMVQRGLDAAYPIIHAEVIAEIVEALSEENQPPSYASAAGFIRARFGA